MILSPLFWLSSLALAGPATPVELVQAEEGWTLMRDGRAFTVRGAGGDGPLDILAAAGGNTIRTWGSDNLDERLDRAHELGLTVIVGIWLGHPRHGFDYSDPAQVAAQREAAKQAILRYRGHPAVLMWGIGNEMEGFEDGDDPAVWAAVEEIAKLAKALDPAHPTMTVTAEIGGARVASVRDACPSIDIHGINTYGGARSIAERYRAAGGTKPYLLTEFGPAGTWEVPRNGWGAPVELTSTEKAAVYGQVWQDAVVASSDLSVGGVAFTWGAKVEATTTWFGMLLEDGTPLGAVDVMTEAWTGKPPADRSPRILPLQVSDPTGEPGELRRVSLDVSHPDGAPLTIAWVLRSEADVDVVGGDASPMPMAIEDAISDADLSGATVRLPSAPGPYRLYAEVRSDNGRAATANIPLLVRGEPTSPLPFTVFDEGFASGPWAPSGWMGEVDKLTVDDGYADGCAEGPTCLMIRFSGREGWGGIAWQDPPHDWGDRPGGRDLTGARALEFWARGSAGSETIEVGVGLLEAERPHPDSLRTEARRLRLKPRWKRYRIDLRGRDLTRVKTPFYVVIPAAGPPIEFVLDRIRFID